MYMEANTNKELDSYSTHYTEMIIKFFILKNIDYNDDDNNNKYKIYILFTYL